MIRLCTCIGLSASTLELSRKRVAAASCKICGGKLGSLSGSMLSTVGLELRNVINPDLTWKTVSKGNRSAPRRARKPFARSLKGSGDLINKDPKRVEVMSVSESEKLGVTVLGRRFSDKVEHVPIKKRRFLFRSPSPPPRTPSPRSEESERLLKNQPVSGKESSPKSIAKQRVTAIETVVANELGQVVNAKIVVDAENSEEINEKLGDNEDFSGIAILAAAACNNSLECGVRNADPCTSSMPVEGTTVSLETTNSSPKDPASMVSNVVDGKNMGAPSFPKTSVAVSQNLPSNKDDGTLRRLESSSRDDRSHWDLNTVMDAWEYPCDGAIGNSQANAVSGIFDNHMHCEKLENLEGCEVQKESVDNPIERTVQPKVDRVVSGDVQDIYRHADSRILVPGTPESNREEHKLDTCVGPDKLTSFQVKVVSSEIDNVPNTVTNLVKETKPVHNQERISSNAESIVSAPVEHTLEPSTLVNTCAVPDENASTQCLNFGTLDNGEILSSNQVVSEDACNDHSSSPGTDHIFRKPVSEESRDIASRVDIVKQPADGCAAADAQRSKTICLRSPHVEKCDASLPDAMIPKKASCNTDNIPFEDGGDADRNSNLLVDGYVPQKTKSMDFMSAQALSPGSLDNAMGESDKVGVSHVSPICEELSASGASVEKSECVVVADTMVAQDVKASVSDGKNVHTIEVDSSVHIDSEEFMHNSLRQTPAVVDKPTAIDGLTSHEACKSCGDEPVNNSGKVALEEDLFDDIDYDSGVSPNDPGHVVGIKNADELQAGYDSQYEDGEVRELVVHSWEEDASDEGEAENVDYGSDNRDTYGFEAAADYHIPMSVEVGEGVGSKKEISAKLDHGDYEGDWIEKKNAQEANCQPCAGGSLKINVLEAGSGKKRAVKAVRQVSRGHFGRINGIEKLETDARVGREWSTGADKVIGDEFCAKGDAAKESSQTESSSMKLSGWDQLPGGCKSSTDTIMEVRDGSGKKNHTGACVDGLNARGSMTGVVGSTASRRELPSHIEGLTSSDMLLGKDRIQGSRVNYFDDSNPRVERDTGSVKFIGRGGSSLHMHGKGRGGDHWLESSGGQWYPNRHHSPNYGPAGFGHLGPKNAAAAAAAKVESSGFVVASDGTIVKAGGVGPNGRGCRQSVNASSQGMHRSLTRRGSPGDRDETFGMHMGLGLVGEISPERSISVGRGRSGRYGSRVVGAGPRERYHGPVPHDSIDSSLHMQHPLARRERSFSPVQRRGAHLSRSRTRSRSRSRTRSPHMWPSPRRRNAGGQGFKQRSRSPNFRSDTRMNRLRSPHRQPGFGAEHIVGFASTPRSRGSPPHASRWIDDRKDVVDHFREHGYKQRSSVSEKSSPARIFLRSHRFDLVDSPVRLKPDEYYRPMHPGRLREVTGAGRGPRYDGSDDNRRKHGDRHRMLHPVRRRYVTDDTVKRFRDDGEDDFAAHNSRNKDTSEFHGRGSPKDYVRGIDSRLGDAPRRAREEKDHFRCGRDGNYNASSKSFGMRECNEDIAPRRTRHS